MAAVAGTVTRSSAPASRWAVWRVRKSTCVLRVLGATGASGRARFAVAGGAAAAGAGSGTGGAATGATTTGAATVAATAAGGATSAARRRRLLAGPLATTGAFRGPFAGALVAPGA